MSAPFWTDYPKRYWLAEDWATWEKAGRPRVPPDMELESPPLQEIGKTLPLPPPGPQSAVTTLFPKPRRREAASARSRAVDRLIEKHVGR